VAAKVKDDASKRRAVKLDSRCLELLHALQTRYYRRHGIRPSYHVLIRAALFRAQEQARIEDGGAE
jgi:hypothetical protein